MSTYQEALDFTTRRETRAEQTHRNTQSSKLREALSDGLWHLGAELDVVVGWRFGGALERIRKGRDNCPIWEVLSERPEEDGSRWRYRWTGRVLEEPQLLKRAKCCPHCGESLSRGGGQ